MIQLPMKFDFDGNIMFNLLSNVIGQGFVKVIKIYDNLSLEIEMIDDKPKLYTICENGVSTDLIVCMVFKDIISGYCSLETWNNYLGERLLVKKKQKKDERFDMYEPMQDMSLYLA